MAIVRLMRELDWAETAGDNGVSPSRFFDLLEPRRSGFTPPKFENQPDYVERYGQAAKKSLDANGDKLRLRKRSH